MVRSQVIIERVFDPNQLVRYAAVAQLAKLDSDRLGRTPVLQRQVAERAGIAPPNLSSALTGRSNLTERMLERLDDAVVTLAPQMAQTGGLASFSAKLRLTKIVSAKIPVTWAPELLRVPPNHSALPGHTGIIALSQASALLSTFEAAGPDEVGRICAQYHDELKEVVDGLILVGVAPPTSLSVEALLLLGTLARYAFTDVERELELALETNPLGFRVWRAVTTIVRLSTDPRVPPAKRPGPGETAKLREWVRLQLSKCVDLRKKSVYPARSLDLELAMEVPRDWSPPEDDWAGNVLRARADTSNATVRERGMAALCLWERHKGNRNGNDVRDYLSDLIPAFRTEADSSHGVKAGLRWAATLLEWNINNDVTVSNSWPNPDEPPVAIVREAAAGLDVDERIKAATQFLFEHAVLQNAGIHRRRAIDTLRAGGWAEEVTVAFGEIAKRPDVEPWLRSRALFAIGFLQERGFAVRRMLQEACNAAWERLRLSERTGDLVSEMHAALFAVGDCFGAAGAEKEATAVRQGLDNLLEEILVASVDDEKLFPVARAATYLLSFTSTPGDETSKRLLSERLREHPDSVTRDFGTWAVARLWPPS